MTPDLRVSLPCLQIWHLHPETQTEVDLALKGMQRMTKPIIAFHVRGSGRDANLLFDVRPLHLNLKAGKREISSS